MENVVSKRGARPTLRFLTTDTAEATVSMKIY
jgi:hypothetical protein